MPLKVTIMEKWCLCYTAIYGIFVQVLVLLKGYIQVGPVQSKKKSYGPAGFIRLSCC